jgi:hypothetical protein
LAVILEEDSAMRNDEINSGDERAGGNAVQRR